MNKVLDTKSTNKIFYLNLAAYNLAAYNLAAYKIKSTNKTFISYNHFKGSKKAFKYNPYNSIKLVRFWLIDRLECFKISINNIIRLKIYKWSLVEIILLISNFDWSKIWIKRYGQKPQKLGTSRRFLTQINPISDWSKISIWGNVPRFGELFNFISG